jgi:large subunit ribosomal protein L6e
VLEKVAGPDYFTKNKAAEKKKSEEAFFKQGEQPAVGRHGTPLEVRLLTMFPQKKPIASSRASDQKSIDKTLLSEIKKEQFLGSYLASNFSLRKGDKPHEMVF